MPAYSRILLPWDSQPQEVVEVNGATAIGQSLRSLILPSVGLVDLIAPSRTITKDANTNTSAASDGIVYSSSDANSGLHFSGGFGNIVPATSTITFFARVYVAALGVRRVIAADWSAAGASQSCAFEQTATNQWRAYRYDGLTMITGGTVTAGWHNVVLSYFPHGGAQMWVDGVSLGTMAGVTSRGNGSSAAWLDSGAYTGSIGWSTNQASLMAIGEMFATDANALAFHENPWGQLFAPRSIWIPVSAGGGVSGTLATTNANDTSSAVGTTTIVGTLATTNANDTAAANGTTTVLGTVTATNANDTCAASGTVGSSGSTGTVAYTNADDTAAAQGTTTVTGTAARTNENDSISASGWVGAVTGTFNVTNANDTAQASGTAAGGVQTGGGGYLPSFRRKTRKEIHAERVRLGILPEQIRKAAKKVVEKAAEQGDPQEVYEDNTEKYKAMFLREVGATKWAPDYARAIRIQLELMERDAEDALLLM